jgi:hypothetical protein
MATKRTFPTRALALLSLVACGLPDRSLGELATDSDAGSSSDATTSAGGSDDASVTGAMDGSTSAGPPIPACEDLEPPIPCSYDLDQDNIAYPCDNAPDVFNPSQSDVDADDIGDVEDLCPIVAGDNNTGDSDRDGIGNACDSCPSPVSQYNLDVSLPAGMQVRNIPDVGDADGDGVGDACDNCVIVPNCGSYDTAMPWAPGATIERDDPTACQGDEDQDMIGDACEGSQSPDAAGPVGWLPDDDFDQDGLANGIDYCTRLPLRERITCDDDSDCPDSTCGTDTSLCNHPDHDGDQVGDLCDTCPFAANGEQLEEGGSQEDDEDGDFVGQACEAGCGAFDDPAPMAFYTEIAEGMCCTVALVEEGGELLHATTGAPLVDPDGLPVRLLCSPQQVDARECRVLPPAVAATPGILTLPPGCAEAGTVIDGVELEGGLAEYWSYRCELPQLDQDFDGLGDRCDFCPFAFDPDNIAYIDDEGRVWPLDGQYCNGAYSADAQCGE